MLGEGREVFDLALWTISLNLPYADMVVPASGCEPAPATGLKVGRVDGGVLVVPVDDEGRCLHRVAMEAVIAQGGWRMSRIWKAMAVWMVAQTRPRRSTRRRDGKLGDGWRSNGDDDAEGVLWLNCGVRVGACGR